VESTAGIEQPGKMNGSPEILSNDAATLIMTVILIFTLYWSTRGFIQSPKFYEPHLLFYHTYIWPLPLAGPPVLKLLYRFPAA
jgi:hypothetical protein